MHLTKFSLWSYVCDEIIFRHMLFICVIHGWVEEIYFNDIVTAAAASYSSDLEKLRKSN